MPIQDLELMDGDTDHILLTDNMRLKTLKLDKKAPPLKFDLGKLEDKTVLEEYNVETSNIFTELVTNWTANESAPDEVW